LLLQKKKKEGSVSMNNNSFWPAYGGPRKSVRSLEVSTKKHKYPRLTVTGKGMDGKAFIVLHCFLPQQTKRVYRWLVLVVPFWKLLWVDPGQVLMIISDGDLQEMHQLNPAINQHWN
jgi:hypothetical protein